MRKASHWVLLGVLGFALSVACSSSEGDDDDSSSNNNGSDSGTTAVDDWPTDYEAGPEGGGLAVLTDEEVDAMQNAACTGWSAEPESLPALLMILVDTSLSMDSNAPNSRETKWEITAAALHEAIDSLPESMPLGLMFYPNRGLYQESSPQEIEACVDVSSLVPVAPNQHDALHAAVDAVRPDGCTPTHGAYEYALEHGVLATNYPGNPYLVLITDGQPTLTIDCMGACNPANPVPTQPIADAMAAALADHATRTFVIGSPGSEENETTGEDVRYWLSEAAADGGTATEGCSHDGNPHFCHFDMSQATDFGEALRGALGTITGQVISCSYEMPLPPEGETIDPDEVNLVIHPGEGGNVLLLRANSADCREGWYYDENGNIALCQDSCARAQSDNQAALQLFFGCETQVAVPE